MDVINGQQPDLGTLTRVEKAANLQVSGWAAMLSAKTVPAVMLVQLRSVDRKSQYYSVARSGAARPDVAKVFGDPAYASSGFNVSSKLDAVPAGEYDVNVALVDDSAISICFGKKRISVR